MTEKQQNEQLNRLVKENPNVNFVAPATPSKEVERGEGAIHQLFNHLRAQYPNIEQLADEEYWIGRIRQPSAPLPEGKGVEALEKEITRLQEKYDENGYDASPLIKLQRIEDYFDTVIKMYQSGQFTTPHQSPKGVEGLQWVKASEPPPRAAFYICWCKNPSEPGLVHYHPSTGWGNGFYNDRVTHWTIISEPTPLPVNKDTFPRPTPNYPKGGFNNGEPENI